MRIHGDFTGGNIEVVDIRGTQVYLKNQIRDTMEDWFYWAFCVEGAQGKTVTFHFDKKWVGYYGPAVSRDLIAWKWLSTDAAVSASDSFTYTFSAEEKRVYFAHNMLYHPSHFERFCEKYDLEIQTLCRSEAGRNIPYVVFGEGERTILLTARHHACEATGDYVMEGVLEELLHVKLPGFRVVAVPFVDYDGVVSGDQGKSRAPWDHNRDYDEKKESIYASVREIKRIAKEGKLQYAFDFHSPWHLGGDNDHVFLPLKHYSSTKNDVRFANFMEAATTPEALPYYAADTMPPDQKWNSSETACFGNYMYWAAGAELAFTLETPYFQACGCMFTPERARETGRCFARALRGYHMKSVKISFTGDLLYQQPMHTLCKTGDGYNFTPPLLPVWARLPDADYLVGNLETPVAGEENDGYTHERYRFNTPEAALAALKKIGFDLLSLANNHCMDRGVEGIFATLDACDRAGLDHIGLYRTQEESEAVCIREIGGIKIGFVNATYGTNAFAHGQFLPKDKKYMVRLTQPEETLTGSVHLLDPLDVIEAETKKCYEPVQALLAPYLERLQREIERVRQQADFVVMLLHSGGQYNTVPEAYTQMLVEKIREYGADLIIANHPHILLPSSLQDGYFTAYCLGNLLSMVPGDTIDCPVNPDFSAVVNLYLERKGGKLEKHITFRLFELVFEDGAQSLPRLTDTFERWRSAPSEAYRQRILSYANRFMPGMQYTEPKAEYPVC